MINAFGNWFDYTKAIQIDSTNGYAYYWRGTYYKAIGENAKAQADFIKAKKLGYNPGFIW